MLRAKQKICLTGIINGKNKCNSAPEQELPKKLRLQWELLYGKMNTSRLQLHIVLRNK